MYDDARWHLAPSPPALQVPGATWEGIRQCAEGVGLAAAELEAIVA